MSKSYSVFVDDKYYYDFVALYNSWKYYENKIPLKVYVHNGMHTADRLNQIEKVCKVVYVDRGDMDTTNYLEKFLFKYVGFIALDAKDLRIGDKERITKTPIAPSNDDELMGAASDDIPF
jgi:hypothetical protein